MSKLPITDDMAAVLNTAYAKKNRAEGFKSVAQASQNTVLLLSYEHEYYNKHFLQEEEIKENK